MQIIGVLRSVEMKLSLLIPFYNEEEQVQVTLNTVIPIMESLDCVFEILVIDDGSKDKTWEIISQAAQADPRIHALKFSRNFGKEAAICAGLENALGDAVILMDGDLQHPPHYIPEMVRLWLSGYDVVEGVKSSRGNESKVKNFFANSFYKSFQKVSGVDLNNASDFKLLDRKVVDAWNKLDEHNTFFRGLSSWLGFKRTEFDFAVEERMHGESKWTWSGLWKLAINAVTSFSTVLLSLITWMGVLFMTLAVVIGIITLVRFFTGHAADGFTTVILLLLIIGGAVMMSLGLISTYIAKIYDEVKGRPRYITMDELNTTYLIEEDEKDHAASDNNVSSNNAVISNASENKSVDKL